MGPVAWPHSELVSLCGHWTHPHTFGGTGQTNGTKGDSLCPAHHGASGNGASDEAAVRGGDALGRCTGQLELTETTVCVFRVFLCFTALISKLITILTPPSPLPAAPCVHPCPAGLFSQC